MIKVTLPLRIFAMIASMLLLNACTTTIPEVTERRDPIERRPASPPPVYIPPPKPQPKPRPPVVTRPYPSQTPARTTPTVPQRRPSPVVRRPADKAETGVNPYDNVPQVGGAPRSANSGAATPAAVKTLLVQARVDVLAARYDASASKLERALRIAPRNAEVWHQLALVNYKQKKYAPSITMAKKSNSYTPTNSRLEKANWALIKQASKDAGDIKTLKEAIQYERFNP